MTAKKVLALFTLVGIVVVSMFVLLRHKDPTPAELLRAEQEVYAFLLLDQKSAYNEAPDKLQIIEYTNSGELQGNTPGDSAGYNLPFDTDNFPEIQQGTLADFQEKNKRSYPIKGYLPFATDVILVNPTNNEINSEVNHDQFFFWVSFSRIGFNSSLTQALVLVGDCRGESCYNSTSVSMYSQGSYVLLQKNNGEWAVQGYQAAWLIEAPSP